MSSAGKSISVASRIGLILGAMFVLVSVVLVVAINLLMKQGALDNAEKQARIVLDRNLAIHAYFGRQLKPKIYESLGAHIGKGYFEPEWMSSTYAVREINKYSSVFSEYDYYYKECAVNARSPENEADDHERVFIEKLNVDPKLIELAAVRKINGSPFFEVLRRGETMDETCLRCHSIYELAPEGLLHRYGKTRSFGRKVGEVVSAVSIRIPLASAYRDADRISFHLSLYLVLILAAIFCFLFWLNKRLVFSPLLAISRKADQIATSPEHLGEEIPLPSGRELEDFTASFNAMSLSLRQKMEQLKRQAYYLDDMNRDLKREVEEKRLAQEEQKLAEEEMQRLNRLYNVLSRTNEMILHTQDRQALFNEACRIAVEQGLFMMAWIGVVDETTHFIKPVAMYGNYGEYLDEIRISVDDIPEGRGPTGTAMRERRHFICKDIEHEPFMEPWRKAALAMGYLSSAAFPLLVGGSVKGVFTVYAPDVNWFNDDEIGLLDELASDISYALSYLEKEKLRTLVEEERKKLIHELNERIKELTALQQVALITQDANSNVPEILRKIVDILPAAWQYPEITAACIKYDHIAVTTANFLRSKWIQNSIFTTFDGKQGIIEVLYLEDRPDEYEGPFLEEERTLIDSIADMLKSYLERKRAEDALKLSYVYNRNLIEASLDPLVTINPDGKITDVNLATEAVTGYPRSELMGRDFSGYFTEPEKARAGYRQAFETGFVRDYPLEIRHLNGRITSVLYNAAVYRDESGGIIGVFAAARDISERKEAEREIRKLNADLEHRVVERTVQLEAANKELEAFSYSVSHDLRSPLRAIQGFSEIIMEDYQDKLDEEGKKALGHISANVRKMAQLIDDLLNFSRMGQKDMMKAEVDMKSLARSVFEELSQSTPGRLIQFDLKDLPHAYGDTSMLRQVFVNLISNSLKFTKSRETAVVEVGCKAGEKENIYYVKDNGVGFDMNYADRLFGVFQRLHEEAEFEGTGVGLALVKRIISRHNGRVWAEGKAKEGATFYFTLPNI